MNGVWKKHGAVVEAKKWRQVRHLVREDGEWTPGDDDWEEKEARKIADKLADTLAPVLRKFPSIVSRALELVDPRLPSMLISEWRTEAEETLADLRDEHERAFQRL